jgi:hypothetical protein
MKKVVKLSIHAKGSYAHIVMGCTKSNEYSCGIGYRQGK